MVKSSVADSDDELITTVNYPTAKKLRTVPPDPNTSAISTNNSGTSSPSSLYPKPEQTNIEQTRKINKGTSNERTHIKKTISLLFMFYIIQLATLLPHNSNEPQMTCQAINPPNQSCHVPLATQRLEFLQPAKAIFRPDKMKQIDPKVTTLRPAGGSELTFPAG